MHESSNYKTHGITYGTDLKLYGREDTGLQNDIPICQRLFAASHCQNFYRF